MATPELPSYYGQRTRDGEIVQHPSRNEEHYDTADETPLVAPNLARPSSNDSSREKSRNNNPAYPAPSHSSPQQDGRGNSRHIRIANPYNHDEDGYNTDHSGTTDDRRGRPRRPMMKRLNSVDQVKQELRLPWTKWMNSNAKNHFVAFISEFVGTTMFLFYAFAGTQVANIGAGSTSSTTGATNGFNPVVYLYIAIAFGFSLMVNVWIFFRVSGGLFNPAVTLALALLKAIGFIRAIVIFIAQLTGACLSAYLVSVIFPTPLNVRTTLGPGTSIGRGLVIEMLCTATLVFTIIMLAVEKTKATFIAPIGIGLALFVSELVAVYYTGGSLNPARSFGPAAVTHNFSGVDWIYWVGPGLGSLIAVVFYRFFKVLEYEMANPGQDADGKAGLNV